VSKTDASIEGQYALDLSMPPLLRSAVDGVLISDHEHNLLFQTLKGHINAEVWIIHDESGRSKRASLTFLNQSGSVRAKVHSPDGQSGVRPNLDIEICANSGDVSVSLPRCFRGEITIRANSERVAFSPALGACTAPLLDIPEERVFFVRDELCEDASRKRRNDSGNSNESSGGNKGQGRSQEEVHDALLVHGEYRSVRINWIDEEDLPEMRLPGGRIIVPNLKLGARWKALWNDVGKLVLPVKVQREVAPAGRS